MRQIQEDDIAATQREPDLSQVNINAQPEVPAPIHVVRHNKTVLENPKTLDKNHIRMANIYRAKPGVLKEGPVARKKNNTSETRSPKFIKQ